MSPPSTVHGGQHDTKYVTFELLLHAAFVAGKNWGVILEPARTWISATASSEIPGVTNCSDLRASSIRPEKTNHLSSTKNSVQGKEAGHVRRIK